MFYRWRYLVRLAAYTLPPRLPLGRLLPLLLPHLLLAQVQEVELLMSHLLAELLMPHLQTKMRREFYATYLSYGGEDLSYRREYLSFEVR